MVDPENRLGRLFDYKIIPNGFFVNEDGTLQGKWIGFAVDRPECVDAVDRFRAGALEPFARSPEGAAGSPGVAPGAAPGPAGPASMSDAERELYDTRVRLGVALLAAGQREEAAAEWQKALRTDPGNFVLRKQIWQIRYPEKFMPEIDFDWQKEQLARERAEEAECGPDGCRIS